LADSGCTFCSSLGKQVQEGLIKKLLQLEANAAALKQQHAGGWHSN
jgi:hypothetical protein